MRCGHAARDAARQTPAAPVPFQIRNAPTGLMQERGYGEGYNYAHGVPEAYTPQEYLPDALRGTVVYEPGASGVDMDGGRRPAG